MQMRTMDLGGAVHYADFGGQGSPIVLVHGLGGNHANWLAVASKLTAHGRVLAPDLPGFGRTPPHGRSSALPANRAILERFIIEVAGSPAVLIGNSMGGLISIMQAATSPQTVSGLILADPALPRARTSVGDPRIVAIFAAYSIPFAGEALVARRARTLGPEGMVRETMRICTVDPSRVPDEVVESMIQIARWRAQQPWPSSAYLQAARSLVAIVTRRARFYQMARSIVAPVLVIHGDRDRLVPLASARDLAARTGWQLEILHDAGHVPMLESPDRFTTVVSTWLAGPGRSALRDVI